MHDIRDIKVYPLTTWDGVGGIMFLFIVEFFLINYKVCEIFDGNLVDNLSFLSFFCNDVLMMFQCKAYWGPLDRFTHRPRDFIIKP